MKSPALGRVFLRSFSVQGSWNYETMIGYGFAYALLPVLRAVYRDPEALARATERHAGLFNSHPYLAPLALAAVARLETERQPPELIDRFKTALRGALGGLGDRLVWAGFRPVCMLAALVALVLGVPWWAAVGGFLLVYNVGHVGLRWWSFRVGWRENLRVAARLRGSWIAPIERRLEQVGPFLVGMLVVLLVGKGLIGEHTPVEAMAVAVAAVVGLVVGPAIRRPVELLLLGLVIGGFLWSGR